MDCIGCLNRSSSSCRDYFNDLLLNRANQSKLYLQRWALTNQRLRPAPTGLQLHCCSGHFHLHLITVDPLIRLASHQRLFVISPSSCPLSHQEQVKTSCFLSLSCQAFCSGFQVSTIVLHFPAGLFPSFFKHFLIYFLASVLISAFG